MNREDIFRMAREVGMCGMLTDVVCTHEELEHFAALVAAAEREACADFLESGVDLSGLADNPMMQTVADLLMGCASVIRARGGK